MHFSFIAFKRGVSINAMRVHRFRSVVLGASIEYERRMGCRRVMINLHVWKFDGNLMVTVEV